MASQSEELRKKRFELNRLVDPNWAGGKYGAPGIGGEEVLSALLPAGIGIGGRAASAGVRGFNAAAKKLDPLADFISSPSGRQMLDSMGKSLLFNKLAKEIDLRYGVGSQPWFRQEEKRLQKGREESAAQHRIFDEEREKIIRDFKDSMPYHREKSQKVVKIGMGATIRDVRARQIEQAERKESVLGMLEQLQMQGASKKQIDDFVDHSGVAFNPNRESKVLHDSVLGVKELEQYYPNPEGAQVKALPFEHSINNALRVLGRERDETVAPGLAQKESQRRFKEDPEKWLWNLRGEDVIESAFFGTISGSSGETIDPEMLRRTLEAQGIDPYTFMRFHYLGYDEFDVIPEDVLADIEAGESDTFNYDSVEGTFGQRAKWVKQLNSMIEARESDKYPAITHKILDKGIAASKNIIAQFDKNYDYDADKDGRLGNLTRDELKTMDDIQRIPEGQRMPWQKRLLLKLKSRAQWGKEYTFLDDFWDND